MPGIISQEHHHHRSTTKANQKPYKPRFASKNDLRDRSKGRAEKAEKGVRKTRHQQVMSKFDRKNQAKQHRIQRAKQHEESASIFKGKDGAPRIVAVISLCNDISSDDAIRCINQSVDINEGAPQVGPHLREIDRFKQSIQYLPVNKDLFVALNACRIADYVLFVLSVEHEVDELGETILKSAESQGISNVYVAAQGFECIEKPKRRQRTLESLKSFTQHFFPSIDKIYSIDNQQECLHIVRSICTTTPKGVHWRGDRSWMYAEEVEWSPVPPSEERSTTTTGLVLTGVVRGQKLKSDRLIHIADCGDFQIEQITAAPRLDVYKGKGNAMIVDGNDSGDLLERPTDEQETLEELAPEEVVMDEPDVVPSLVSGNERGVLLDDERFYSDNEAKDEDELPKRLPKGTSKYQSAWYLGNESDSGSDMEDVEEWEQESHIDSISTPADGMEGLLGPSNVEDSKSASAYPQSEPFDDLSLDDTAEAEELAAYRTKRRKTEAEEDREFPDEIELHPNVLARERLSKYRGLRSLKSSPWNTEADQPHRPEEWTRLLDINDYRAAKSKVMRESLVGGVSPGKRVRIHVKDVPISFRDQYDSSKPLTVFSLLRHEHKRTCVNVSITLKSDAPRPIKSKEELIIQVGPRRFTVCPLFSQSGTTPNDVHKFERYLQPGRTAVASFIAPVTWGNVPALFFQKPSSQTLEITNDAMDTSDPMQPCSTLELVGIGTTLTPSTTRIIAKRAILTGQPFKIHKKLVTVRYMLFNAEDVAWFKALRLWTNRRRQGTIKESLGTHGYFKAIFDGRINSQDAVGVSLYRRVWPRWAEGYVL